MISLDDFLAENNMKYADFLAGETRQKLRDIWDEVQEEKGQSLSDAEMDEIIGEFVMLGEIIPADAGMNGRDRYDEVEIPQEEMSTGRKDHVFRGPRLRCSFPETADLAR